MSKFIHKTSILQLFNSKLAAKIKYYYMTKRILFFGCLLAVVGGLSAQTTTVTVNNSNDIKRKREEVRTSSSVSTAIIDLPGFPAYLSTGNKDVDDLNYAHAKENWIKENHELYNAYLYMVEKNLSYKFNLPGYPVYIITGNNDQDYVNYKLALKHWMSSNPDAVALEVRKFYKSSN